MPNHFVALKELRENMVRYSDRVANGESFVVLKRSKPLFKLSPVDSDEQWEEVIDFTKLKKGGVKLAALLKRL